MTRSFASLRMTALMIENWNKSGSKSPKQPKSNVAIARLCDAFAERLRWRDVRMSNSSEQSPTAAFDQ